MKSMWFSQRARFSRLPVERSSRAVTAWPRVTRNSTRCEPMKPAAPVTRKCMGRILRWRSAETLGGGGALLERAQVLLGHRDPVQGDRRETAPLAARLERQPSQAEIGRNAYDARLFAIAPLTMSPLTISPLVSASLRRGWVHIPHIPKRATCISKLSMRHAPLTSVGADSVAAALRMTGLKRKFCAKRERHSEMVERRFLARGRLCEGRQPSLDAPESCERMCASHASLFFTSSHRESSTANPASPTSIPLSFANR